VSEETKGGGALGLGKVREAGACEFANEGGKGILCALVTVY